MRRYINTYIYVFSLIVLLSSCGADKNLKKGDKFYAIGEYFEAAAQYKKAYRATAPKDRAKRGDIALKMAYCYDKINSSPKAIAAYRNAIRYEKAGTDDRLRFARQLLRNGDYKQAAAQFRIVLDSLPGNELAVNGLSSALTADEVRKASSRYKVKKMEEFNSRRADFSPMLTGEEFNLLYFSTTRNSTEGTEISGITGAKTGDIFMSFKNDKGKWSKPEKIEGGLNTEFDEGACCFTGDGRKMYFTRCVSDPQFPRYAEIMTSNRADASWGKATKEELTKDTLSSYAHPALSPDEHWLYFVSDMPGGMGGLDIWRVAITPAGYGGVENLGEPINTPGNEMFPTFRPNGDLYFSSDGHVGLGGLDIFIAMPDAENNSWKIEHPGYPLNSKGDDFGMTFEGVHNRGFFCSSRNDGRGFDHIYSFEKPEIVQTIKGWVYEKDGYELPAAQVYFVGDDGTNKKLSVKTDGSFTEVVTPGVEYLIMATCEGFLNHQESLSIEPVTESTEHVLQFPLASINIPVLIDNIHYDFDKATLRPESEKSLDKLIKTLNENPNITIELSAHCDYRGSDEYNERLSQQRAESVVSYLISHGIEKERLTPKGYGKARPKSIRKRLTEKYTWMKEGDVLSPEYIGKLDEEKQEVCNQLNRRTEFKVLRTTYGLFDKDGRLKRLPPQKETLTEDYDEFKDKGGDVDIIMF